MTTSVQSIELLKAHLHLLSPDKQAVARYVCANWPLKQRYPQGVAGRAVSACGFSVGSLASAERVARELFLEAASFARSRLR
jgi:hypothetical protein